MLYLGLGIILFLIFLFGMIRIEREKRSRKNNPNFQKRADEVNRSGTIIENLVFWTCIALVIFSLFEI